MKHSTWLVLCLASALITTAANGNNYGSIGGALMGGGGGAGAPFGGGPSTGFGYAGGGGSSYGNGVTVSGSSYSRSSDFYVPSYRGGLSGSPIMQRFESDRAMRARMDAERAERQQRLDSVRIQGPTKRHSNTSNPTRGYGDRPYPNTNIFTGRRW